MWWTQACRTYYRRVLQQKATDIKCIKYNLSYINTRGVTRYTRRIRRGAGVVELARLERVYRAIYRGFESLSLRQIKSDRVGRFLYIVGRPRLPKRGHEGVLPRVGLAAVLVVRQG